MAIKGSHRGSRVETTHGRRAARWLRIPLIPTLIGALAMMNVASVVMVLVE